jgi:hypothetical protein
LRVLTAELDPYWPDREIPCPGHIPLACDVDGDGRDELFDGGCLLDHDGTVLWNMALPAHVDELYVADINEDGRKVVIMALCGGGGGIVADALSGRLLWQVPRKHCGFAGVGKYRDDLPGLQVCFTEDSRAPGSIHGAALYDCRGRELWRADDPHAVPRTLNWPSDCGRESLVLGGVLTDGKGKELFRFPAGVDVQAIARRLNRPSPAGLYDWGGGAEFTACDVDGDGAQEAVFNSRERIQVFGLAAPDNAGDTKLPHTGESIMSPAWARD